MCVHIYIHIFKLSLRSGMGTFGSATADTLYHPLSVSRQQLGLSVCLHSVGLLKMPLGWPLDPGPLLYSHRNHLFLFPFVVDLMEEQRDKG